MRREEKKFGKHCPNTKLYVIYSMLNNEIMLKLKNSYLKNAVKNSRPHLESALKTDSEKCVYILDEKKQFYFVDQCNLHFTWRNLYVSYVMRYYIMPI